MRFSDRMDAIPEYVVARMNRVIAEQRAAGVELVLCHHSCRHQKTHEGVSRLCVCACAPVPWGLAGARGRCGRPGRGDLPGL